MTMLDLQVWMAACLLSVIGRMALVMRAFVSGFWRGVRHEWARQDRSPQRPRSSPVRKDATTALQDRPDATSLQLSEAPAKVKADVTEKKVVVLAQRPNR